MDWDIPSKYIKAQFDDKIGHITNGPDEVPFSAGRILTDLTLSGVTVLDALDILFEIRSELVPGIHISTIISLLNRQIISKGYDESSLIRGQQDPLIIEYPEYEEILSFKMLKELLQTKLSDFVYSSRTFKMMVEEFYRVLQYIRTNRFKYSSIVKIIPSVIRSVIELDPFEVDILDQLYSTIIGDYEQLSQTWTGLDGETRSESFTDLVESIFQYILLSYNYLPGYNLQSTISQINVLIGNESGRKGFLTQKELYRIGKISAFLEDSTNHPVRNGKKSTDKWFSHLYDLMSIIVKMANKSAVQWLVLIDKHDREVYSQFSRSSYRRYDNLVGTTIGGVQSLINEVTEDTVQVIEQKDGVIVIESRNDFRMILFLKQQLTPMLQKLFSDLADRIQMDALDEIRQFKGSVTSIKQKINPLIKDQLGNLIEL